MSNRKSVPFETTWRVRDQCLCLASQRPRARWRGASTKHFARSADERAVFAAHVAQSRYAAVDRCSRGAPAMDRTTLTANLKPLIKRRFSDVAVDPNDGRGRCSSSRRRPRALAAAIPIWERTHQDVERLLTQSGPDSCARACARCVTAQAN